MQLFYREQGEGYPIIILHGIFGSSDNWLTVTKKLAEDYKVFLLDLRNHGRSPHADELNYKVMGEDLLEFMEQLNIKEAYLVGHSMGGKVAMKFAVNFPDKVKKLVVVDIAPKYYPIHHDVILRGLNSINLDKISNRQEADTLLSEYVPELDVRQFLLKNLSREENKFRWRINLPVITKEIENVGEPLDGDKKFEKPTLFIKGGKSRYIKDQDVDLIKQIFPEAVIKTIDSAGHWVQAEAPLEFLEVLGDFLNN